MLAGAPQNCDHKNRESKLTCRSKQAGLVAALNGAGLTVLATLVQSQADLASQLQTGGNYTIVSLASPCISMSNV